MLGPFTILATLGNPKQPFVRFVEWLDHALADFQDETCLLQHGNTPVTPGRFVAVSFLNKDEYQAAVHRARVIVTHGGSGSIVHALQAGKVPIVVPRLKRFGEHINDHQCEIASAFEQRGWAIAVYSEDDLLRALKTPKTVLAACGPVSVNPVMCKHVSEFLRRTVGEPGRS